MGAYRDGRSQWRNRLPQTKRRTGFVFFEILRKGKEVRLTMRNRIMAVLVMAMMMALTFSAPAFATHQSPDLGGPPDPPDVPHPFCGSGAIFAHGHVVGLAKGQQIMAPEGGGDHNPGLAHQGFAVCDPTDNDPFE
jgi:hypothetical protein